MKKASERTIKSTNKYESAVINKDYEKLKAECEKYETLFENQEREHKVISIQLKNELERIQSKNDELKREVDEYKEQLIKKKNEVSQLLIYKRMTSRLDEVDKANLDLKSAISQLKDSLKEKDRQIKFKEIEICNLNTTLDCRAEEVKQLK